MDILAHTFINRRYQIMNRVKFPNASGACCSITTTAQHPHRSKNVVLHNSIFQREHDNMPRHFREISIFLPNPLKFQMLRHNKKPTSLSTDTTERIPHFTSHKRLPVRTLLLVQSRVKRVEMVRIYRGAVVDV